MDKHEQFMREALSEAQKAFDKKEVPVGAVVVCDGNIVGRGHNQRETMQLTKAHAEMLAIEDASKSLGSWRLDGCIMYLTLEPCPMCAGAIIQSRINTLYYGTTDEKNGVKASGINVFEGNYTHRVTVHEGLLKDEARTMMKRFFKALRNKEDSV